MCETCIRKADVRRRDRRDLQPAPCLVPGAASDDDAVSDSDQDDADVREEEEDAFKDDAEAPAPLDFAKPGRNSAKAAYLAKVLGSVLGYGADYDLFQFVYDLWLWSALGAKNNTAEAPLRLAMAGYSDPLYYNCSVRMELSFPLLGRG